MESLMSDQRVNSSTAFFIKMRIIVIYWTMYLIDLHWLLFLYFLMSNQPFFKHYNM